MSVQKKFYRLNQQIQAANIRLIDATGKQIGIVTRNEAIRQSQETSLDLVEIAPNAQPPVVKLIDFKKFLYQEEKKKREERKKTQRIGETKEIRLGPYTDEHDLKVKLAIGQKFLQEGDKLRIVVKFTGRQIVHPEFGKKMLEKCLEKLTSLSKLEREPHFEGRKLIALLSPQKRKGNKENETKNEN